MSAVRKVADLGQPTAGPVHASTSSMVMPRDCIRRSAFSMEKVPMRLAMKLGVSLASTTPLPRRRSQKSESAAITSGEVFGPANDFDEFHVARRIEKVRAGPVLLKFFGQAFGDQMDRKAGGIGGNDGAGLAELRDLGQQAALDLQIFGDHFDDPVRIGDARQIILKIADRYFGSQRGRKKRGGLRFFRGFKAGEHDFVAIGGGGVLRNDVEQQAGQAGIGKVCGDARAHGAGAENNGFLNVKCHKQALDNENGTAEQVTKWDAVGQTGVW